VKYLEEIDYKRTEFGDLYDELPLWSAPFGLLLLEHVEMRPGITILDVGAGTGFLSIELIGKAKFHKDGAIDVIKLTHMTGEVCRQDKAGSRPGDSKARPQNGLGVIEVVDPQVRYDQVD